MEATLDGQTGWWSGDVRVDNNMPFGDGRFDYEPDFYGKAFCVGTVRSGSWDGLSRK